jgi:hypothetical protein
MADQKSRGGQKQGSEKQEQGKKNRDVHGTSGQHGQRDMAEDAQRGQQANQGGYNRKAQGDEEQ